MAVAMDLYNSLKCRLCGEENSNGSDIYVTDDNDQNCCDLINQYLPVKVSNDGKLPRTICPGCQIQLEATIDFFNLIIEGQKHLRDLLKCEISNDGKSTELEIDENDELYKPWHHLTLKAAGLERPKRKRGRPKKQIAEPNESVEEIVPDFIESPNDTSYAEVLGKRKRKLPDRFKEVVQGHELERIFREEGVIESEEPDKSNEAKMDALHQETEVIGRLESHDGKPPELITVVRGKGRGRPKGSMGQRIHTCIVCSRPFRCLGRYMSHVATHGRATCSCGQSFKDQSSLRAHARESGIKDHVLVRCEPFEEEYTEEDKLVENVITTEEKEVKVESEVSPLLPDGSQEESNNTIDVQVERMDTDTATENLNKSSLLEQLFLQPNPMNESSKESPEISNTVHDDIQNLEMQSLLLKTELNTQPAVTETCQAEVPSAEANVVTIDTTKKYRCPYCDKTFNNKQNKSVHIKGVHAGLRPFKCKDCGATFAYKRSLCLHAITHAKHNKYACDLCGKVLSHPSSVSYHKEAEHANQRYSCLKCDKSFKHKQLLTRHQLVHSASRPFVCKICNATFKSKPNLLNHQILHTGEKPYNCNVCPQKFAYKTSLTLHMRMHTGTKPYTCTVCGKGFTQKGNLSEHMRIHTGERPHTCGVCERAFTTSSQMKLHLKTHSSERPYSCNICDKSFATKHSWRIHMRRETGAAHFKCAYCGRGFVDRTALAKHTRTHTGQRPYSCPYCFRTFADSSNLYKHKKIHENQKLLTNKTLKLSEQPTTKSEAGNSIVQSDSIAEDETLLVRMVTSDNNSMRNDGSSVASGTQLEIQDGVFLTRDVADRFTIDGREYSIENGELKLVTGHQQKYESDQTELADDNSMTFDYKILNEAGEIVDQEVVGNDQLQAEDSSQDTEEPEEVIYVTYSQGVSGFTIMNSAEQDERESNGLDVECLDENGLNNLYTLPAMNENNNQKIQLSMQDTDESQDHKPTMQISQDGQTFPLEFEGLNNELELEGGVRVFTLDTQYYAVV